MSWFKKRRETRQINRTLAGARIALNRLGELIETYPDAYIDESLLPLPKADMKVALKVLWVAAKDEEQRRLMEMGWSLLSFFQPNVGKSPVSPSLSKGAFPVDTAAKLGLYLEFAKLWEAEMLANKAEFAEFVRSQPT